MHNKKNIFYEKSSAWTRKRKKLLWRFFDDYGQKFIHLPHIPQTLAHFSRFDDVCYGHAKGHGNRCTVLEHLCLLVGLPLPRPRHVYGVRIEDALELETQALADAADLAPDHRVQHQTLEGVVLDQQRDFLDTSLRLDFAVVWVALGLVVVGVGEVCHRIDECAPGSEKVTGAQTRVFEGSFEGVARLADVFELSREDGEVGDVGTDFAPVSHFAQTERYANEARTVAAAAAADIVIARHVFCLMFDA